MSTRRWEELGEVGEALSRLDQALSESRLEAAREALDAVDAAWPLDAERLGHLTRLMDLGELAAELAHELRQPLLGIKAFAQMVAEAPEDAIHTLSRAKSIVVQARRMEHLLDRVSAYARGRETLPAGEPLRGSLTEAVQATADLMGARLRAEGIRLALEVGEPTPPVPVGDVALQQVVVNLVNNAREAFEGRGGTVGVSVAREDGAVVLRVCDDGPGVPESLRVRLFDPFATSKPQGSGLGLHVCRRIVEAAGGTVGYRALERGSEFAVTLPPADGAAVRR